MAKKTDPLGISSAETVLSSSVKVQGDINSDGDIVIDGVLRGNVRTSGNINLGVNAKVKGDLEARNITIAGRIEGNVAASDQFHITETGELQGNFTCQILSVAPGALFIGTSNMQPRSAAPATEETS